MSLFYYIIMKCFLHHSGFVPCTFILHCVSLLTIANAWCCRQEERIGAAACRSTESTSGQAEWAAAFDEIQLKHKFWEEKQELWNYWSIAGILVSIIAEKVVITFCGVVKKYLIFKLIMNICVSYMLQNLFKFVFFTTCTLDEWLMDSCVHMSVRIPISWVKLLNNIWWKWKSSMSS